MPGPLDRFFYRYLPPFSAMYGFFFGGSSTSGKTTTFYNRVDRESLDRIAENTTWQTMSESARSVAGTTSKGSGGRNFRSGGLLAAAGISDRHDSMLAISTGAMTHQATLAFTLQEAAGGSTKDYTFVFAGIGGGGVAVRKKVVKSTAVPADTGFVTIGSGRAGDVNETTNYFFVGPIGSVNVTRMNRISALNGSGGSLWGTLSENKRGSAVAGNENRTFVLGGNPTYKKTTEVMSNHSMAIGRAWVALGENAFKFTAASSQYRSVISPWEKNATPGYFGAMTFFDHNIFGTYGFISFNTSRADIKSGSGSN